MSKQGPGPKVPDRVIAPRSLGSRLRNWIARGLLDIEDHQRLAVFQNHINEGRVEVGRFTYGVPGIRADRGTSAVVRIGQFCSIASGVTIFSGGNHNPAWVSTFPLRIRLGLEGAFSDGMPATKGDVIIGNDVWIGSGAVVLSGVTVGHGAVIGACAVVARNVSPYAIVVGNPAREIRSRFPTKSVEALLRISWWDWPIEKIVEATPFLSSSDVDEFVRKFDENKLERSPGVALGSNTALDSRLRS